MIRNAMSHNWHRLLASGVLTVVLFCYFLAGANSGPAALRMPALAPAAQATPVLHLAAASDEGQMPLYRRDPLAYLKQCRRNYNQRVRDYVCTFSKRELVEQELTDRQVAEIKFREGPFSVYMHILTNPGKARRVLYVKDAIVKNNEQFATIEPESAAWRLLVRSVQREIAGTEMLRASRKPISDFGFKRSLDLIIKYIDLAEDSTVIRYVGEGQIDGRSTHVFERRLPYSAEDDRWPDALLIVQVDAEWQVPVSCTAYADYERKQLLGDYQYTDVHFNLGLGAREFDPATYGL